MGERGRLHRVEERRRVLELISEAVDAGARQSKACRAQRESFVSLLKEPQFCNLPPKQIVPALADEGRYTVSEATMYRILPSERLLTHRGASRPRTHHRPPEPVACEPNRVWCWDISVPQISGVGDEGR